MPVIVSINPPGDLSAVFCRSACRQLLPPNAGAKENRLFRRGGLIFKKSYKDQRRIFRESLVVLMVLVLIIACLI